MQHLAKEYIFLYHIHKVTSHLPRPIPFQNILPIWAGYTTGWSFCIPFKIFLFFATKMKNILTSSGDINVMPIILLHHGWHCAWKIVFHQNKFSFDPIHLDLKYYPARHYFDSPQCSNQIACLNNTFSQQLETFAKGHLFRNSISIAAPEYCQESLACFCSITV